MNINYLSRLTHNNAKSGNYNSALKKTSSPFIITFDADMAPTRDFITKTLPYFFENNANVGLVQAPQSFINPDIFQYRFKLENSIPFEQEYFYHELQIAKNKTNSTVCCGTNTIFLRQALKDAGGFATGTISEDIATGMIIESKGYKCIAINDILAYGENTNSLDGFIKQRSRWARGCVQMLKKYKIINLKGLSIRQKLEYLSCVSYWFFGFKRMIYMITPLLFSILGIIIIDCDLKTFLALWLPAYILKRFTLDKSEHNKRSATWNKIYETIMAPVLSKEVLKEFFGFGSSIFEVTPKSKQISNKMSKLNKKLLLSHTTLLLLNILGFVLSLFRLYDNSLSAYILSFVWTISNIFYLIIAVIFDCKTKPHTYDNFIPNKINKYSLKSIFLIFINRKKDTKTCQSI
jgi:cellulose synthase (UDP-forming)